MLKSKPHPDHPPEEGRYLRGNDNSPVVVVIILHRDEDKIPPELEKLIRVGIESSAVMARFETERQALALMNHRNIARVLDVGTTEHGRPYFAMEYVDGERITAYCDRNRLPLRERLRQCGDVVSESQPVSSPG